MSVFDDDGLWAGAVNSVLGCACIIPSTPLSNLHHHQSVKLTGHMSSLLCSSSTCFVCFLFMWLTPVYFQSFRHMRVRMHAWRHNEQMHVHARTHARTNARIHTSTHSLTCLCCEWGKCTSTYNETMQARHAHPHSRARVHPRMRARQNIQTLV